MFKRILVIGGLTIGAYLVLTHATGARTFLNGAGTNSVNVIKAFQGR